MTEQVCGFSSLDLDRIATSMQLGRVEHHRELDSTNTRAVLLAGDPELPLPALVLADLQTQGRGRGDNTWWSASGALTFSWIVRGSDRLAPAHGPCLSLTAGLAVCEALQEICPGLPIGLKWPNDVFVHGRKICGILVEAPARAGDRVIIGIGVNVNNSLRAAPAPVSERATSLVDVAGYTFPLATVLIQILQRLTQRCAALERGDAGLGQRWQALCMLTGNRARVEAGSVATEGICRGIDARGALLIDTGTEIRPCVTGVVTILETDGNARHNGAMMRSSNEPCWPNAWE